MPARSKAQREAMAIAEHHPEQLYGRNRGLLKMTHQQLHDFAATPERNLPARAARGQFDPSGAHLRRREAASVRQDTLPRKKRSR